MFAIKNLQAMLLREDRQLTREPHDLKQVSVFEISGVEILVLVQQFKFRKATLHGINFQFEKLMNRVLEFCADLYLSIQAKV